ncbi:nodulation factor ABC transporter ATP-binding protein NodI, partial [Burkholderia sp. SIMBA_052]
TTGLDPQTRHLIWGRLRELVARGKTIFLTTHVMEEAERMCDALCVLEKGRKIAEGRPSILIAEQIGADVIEIYGPTPPGLRARIAPHAAHIES